MDATYGLGRRPDWGCMADWTPVGCWRGVQIVDLGRIGRHLRVGAASRLEMYGGLDATYRLGRRPDLGYMADWTPLTGWGGVQIWVVERIGRLLDAGVASGFLVAAGLDACCAPAWRPMQGWRMDWTPTVNNRGVQIENIGRNGRHYNMYRRPIQTY